MVFFPVNLNITDRLCIVVGGGHVALRKIRALVSCRARVKVVSPDVLEEIETLACNDEVALTLREYRKGDLEGAFLVFAATDNPKVQREVSLEAKERNILLNSVTDPGRCDFQIPAKIRRGDLLLTISTGGASPALSKLIREQLEEQFTDEYGAVIELFARIREVVVGGPGTPGENKLLFQQLVLSDIVDCALRNDWKEVQTLLEQILPGSIDAGRIVDLVAASAGKNA